MSEKQVERLDIDLGVFYATKIVEAPKDLPKYRTHAQYALVSVRGVDVAEVWARSTSQWYARFLKGDRKIMEAARMEAVIAQIFMRRVRSTADPKTMTLEEREDTLLPSAGEQKNKLKRDFARVTSRAFVAELHRHLDDVRGYLDRLDQIDGQKYRQKSKTMKAVKAAKRSKIDRSERP